MVFIGVVILGLIVNAEMPLHEKGYYLIIYCMDFSTISPQKHYEIN